MAKKNKSQFSIRKLIYNDKYLIIMSVILAIVVWCATSINLSPQTSKTITIPVAVDFTDTVASQLGIKCYGDETINVDVTISCKKYLAKDINAEDLNVYLQTSTVTSTGNYEVPIRVESLGGDFTIDYFYPTTYRAYFDVEEERSFDVNINYQSDDFIEDGYVMGDVILSDNSVTVKGPKSYMAQVDSVVADVKFDNKINTTQSLDLPVNAIDDNGVVVPYVKCITKNDNLNVTIPVLKETVLNVSSNFTGKPNKLSENEFDISYSTNSVKAGVLEEAGINEANLGNIDFSSLNVGKNEFVFNLAEIDSFKVLDDISEIKATVTVPDSYTSTSLGVNKNNVEFTNVPDGYDVELVSLSSYSVTVIGKSDNLNSLTSNDVELIVDLSNADIKDGTAVFNVATALNNDYCWVYGKYTATVRLINA